MRGRRLLLVVVVAALGYGCAGSFALYPWGRPPGTTTAPAPPPPSPSPSPEGGR